ncbi:hypothetical protein Tco_0001776 [Tanacetum coccineum]
MIYLQNLILRRWSGRISEEDTMIIHDDESEGGRGVGGGGRSRTPQLRPSDSADSCPFHEAPPSGTPPLLPIPLPTPSPPLLLPSTDRRADMPEVCLPPQKRLCIAQGPRYEVGESSSAPRPTGSFRVDYGFVATLDDEIRRDPERDDTNKIYVRLDDAQDDKSLMSGRLNMLFRDRRAHARTALLMEREARLSPDGDCSLASSRPRSTLRLMSTLQTQVTALQGQQGPASGPSQPKIPEEAGSSS